MTIVVIGRELGAIEHRCLVANLRNLRAYSNDVQVVFVANRLRDNHGIDGVHFLQTTVRPHGSQCAAANRMAGWRFALEELKASEGLILFVDGDMVLSSAYLEFLMRVDSEPGPQPTLVCSKRVDVGIDAPEGEVRRIVDPTLNSRGHFRRIYGAFAVRNMAAEQMIPSHDEEEQWLLANCLASYGAGLRCLKFDGIGVNHLDRFQGAPRLGRWLSGSRGVGWWQGLAMAVSGQISLKAVWSRAWIPAVSIVLVIVLAQIHPLLPLLLLLVPRFAKRALSLFLGLVKVRTYPVARSIDYEVMA